MLILEMKVKNMIFHSVLFFFLNFRIMKWIIREEKVAFIARIDPNLRWFNFFFASSQITFPFQIRN